MRFLEKEKASLQDDLESMISRLAEVERENTDFRINSDKLLIEEKRRLLMEVEEIRRREESLEAELSEKLETEIARMNSEQEQGFYSKIIRDLSRMFKVCDNELGEARYNYDLALEFFENRVKYMNEKMEVLTENKELLMRERRMFEERINDINF